MKKEGGGYHGYCVDFADLLGTEFPFIHELREVADGMYGAQDENGTWNGMIGELTDGVCLPNY